MAQCVGTWGDCACHPVTRDHFADRGYALQAGLTATPDGRVLACYSVDQEIVVATRIEREVVDIFPVSLFDGGAGEDCDIEAGPGELVQLVYGEVDGADRRLVHHELDLDGNLGPASFPVTDINDNGHAPRLFVGAGGVEIVSAARFGAVGYLEHHRKAGGIWTPALVAQLPGPTVDQAVVRCGGESVVAYLALDTDRSTLEVAVGGPPTWDVAPVDQKDDRAGPGPSLACAGGQVHGIFQNTTESRLVELTSTAPALVGSYTATPIDVGHAVGLSTDLRIANDTLYVVYARTTGEVQVAARPLDGSSGWRTYSFAGPDDVEGSALAGDVGLAIDQDGLPVVLFFGVFGDGAGPWLATVDPSR